MNKDDLHFVHVVSEAVEYNRKGVKTSRPALQMFTEREWGKHPSDGMQGYYRRLQKTYTVLYKPGEVLASEAEPEPAEPSEAEPTAKRGRKKAEE